MSKTNKQPDSPVKQVLAWVFTIIGVVLLVRLAITLFNLAFNLSETSIGGRMAEGGSNGFIERLGNLSPRAIVIQAAIIIVVLALIVASRKTNRKSGQPHGKRRRT